MNTFSLKRLADGESVLRCEAMGKISRDGWNGSEDPFVELLGESVYAQPCLLSLGHALYVDSTGVEWLLTAHRRFVACGGVLILHSLTPASRQLLKLMRMDLVLHIVDDEQAALALLAARNRGHVHDH